MFLFIYPDLLAYDKEKPAGDTDLDETQEPRLTPFDQMISDENIQMLKAAIPYAPVSMQNFLSVFAKFRELQNTMSMIQRPPSVRMMSQNAGPASMMDMMQDIGKYATGSKKAMFDNMSSAFTAVQMFQAYQNMSTDTSSAEEENGGIENE